MRPHATGADEVEFPLYPASRAVALTMTSGLFGYGLFRALPRVARALGVSPSLLEYCAMPVLWNGFTICVMAYALRRYEGKRLNLKTAGVWPITWRRWDRRSPWLWLGPTLMGALLGIGASPLGIWSIERLWRAFPGPSWSIGSLSAYKGHFPLKVTGPLVAYQLAVRIPLTVLTEEAFFRGFLQPRRGRTGPIESGVLFAAYHLTQWWTIPSLLPTGLALAVARWWTGNIWVGAAGHYIGDAVYIVRFL